jgi:hypothetical protein
VGPFFALLYRGLEKLPRLRGVRAQRVVAVGNDDGLPEVRAMFDGHETLCAAGAAIHFRAFASFARRDAGGSNEIALPSAENSNDTIVYRCDALECVDVTPFLTVPRDGADGVEVLPLPPLVTTVVSAAMQPGRSKTLVVTLQQQPNDGACYVVPRVAAAAPAETPEQLMERGAAAFSADKFAEAAAIYTQVIDLCRGAASANNAGDFLKRALLNRSGAFCFLGEHERALSDAQELCTKSHPQLAKAWARCAAALQGLKRYAEAAEAYTTAAQATDRKGAEEPAQYLQSANEMRAAAVFDKTAPLAVMLLRQGLTEQQIVQDGWMALMSLPREVVVGLMAATFSEAMKAALARHVNASLRDNLLKLKPSSALSCELWCVVLTRFALHDNGRRVLGTAAVRDALLAVVSQATTVGACTEWCNALCNLTSDGYSALDVIQQLFGIVAVRDALVALRPLATTADACDWWCTAICNLNADNDANKQLFGAAAVRDALVALASQATTAESCRWWCSAICTLTTRNAANQNIFGTPVVRDTLVALRPQARTADACRLWCTALSYLTNNNDTNQQLFGTAAVRDALVALQPRAATAAACESWCQAICDLCFAGGGGAPGASPATRRNLQLLRVPSVRKAHAALKGIASSSMDAKGFWDAAALALAFALALADDEPAARA